MRPPNTQYLGGAEMNEVYRLLRCLDGLKSIAPAGFGVYDSNGELLGRVDHSGDGWAFWYPEPQEEQ